MIRTVTQFSALEIACTPCRASAGEQCIGGPICPERVAGARAAADSGVIQVTCFEPPLPDYSLIRDGLTGRQFTQMGASQRGGKPSRLRHLLPEAKRLRAQGLLQREIAEKLGVSVATVAKWLHEGRALAN